METSLHLGRVESEPPLTPATVVVPTDGTATAQAALPVARWLCAAFDADLARVTVATGAHDAVGLVDAEGAVDLVLHGSSVAAALGDHLDQQPGALVCMASRARGGLHRRLNGTLVDELIDGGAAPVVVVGPGWEVEAVASPPATILVAASEELPAGAAQLSGRWAMAMDADVVVATVLPPVAAGGHGEPRRQEMAGGRHAEEGFLGGVTSFPAGEQDPLLGPLVRELADGGIASAAVSLVGGTVATSLLAFAESLPPPVLIVAPVGQREGRIPGDVTHQLVQRSRWPVVASLGRAPAG